MNEKSVPEQAQAVVASPNMVPPNLRKALESAITPPGRTRPPPTRGCGATRTATHTT